MTCELCDGTQQLHSGDACPCTMGAVASGAGRYRVVCNGVPDYARGLRWWQAKAEQLIADRPRTHLELQQETRLLSGEWETIAELGKEQP